MNKRAIVTCGVSATRLFAPYLQRFKETFLQYGCADYIKIYHQNWPPGSPSHHDVHYGFKVHAVCDAWSRGFDSILWLDSSCHAIAPLLDMWGHLEREGHILIEDENRVGNWSSDHSLKTFGITRDEAMNYRIMCGTCWGVDLRNDRSQEFVRRLRSYATKEHFNGTHVSRLPGASVHHPRPGTEGFSVSDDERCWGHRCDEVYMQLIARELGMKTHNGHDYFAGGGGVSAQTCIRSGYDLPQPERPASRPPDPRNEYGHLDYGTTLDVD